MKMMQEDGVIERVGGRRSGQWVIKQDFTQRKDIKKKLPIDQEIYLPEYFSGTVARFFDKESDQRILYWDFSKDLDEKLKMQTALLLNEIVKSIKNREERRNRYLLPLKCLFCYAEKVD